MPDTHASAVTAGNTTNLALDRVAAAADQSVVVDGLSRTLILFGLLFAGASLWPPANVAWAGMALLASLAGAALVLPYRLARHQWMVNVLGMGFILLAAAALALAVRTVTPLARITPFADMTAEFDAALAIANGLYGTTPWLIARAVAAVLLGLLSIELIAAYWLLLRLDADERRLLARTSRRGTAGALNWLFDLPPAAGRYFHSAPVSLTVLLLGILLFMTAATNIAGSWVIQAIGALKAVADCLDRGSLDTACFEGMGQAAAGGMVLLAFCSVVIFPLLGTLLTRRARSLAARSAAKRLNQDKRPPILFLRSFEDDQVTLMPPRRTPMRFALGGLRPPKPVDILLLEEFLDRAPARALGRPGEKVPPFGALRDYLTDEKWRARVRELAEAALAIVIVFDTTISDSVSWELSTLANNPQLRAKTVFAVHPDVPANERAAAWQRMGEKAGLSIPNVPDLQTISFDVTGRPWTTSAGRITATTMRLVMQHKTAIPAPLVNPN